MKTLLTILSLISLLQIQACSPLANYDASGKQYVITAKTTLSVTGVPVRITTEKQAAGLALAAGTILPPLVDLIVTNAREEANRNTLAYAGEYRCEASGEKFYMNNDFASLPGLTIKRMIRTNTGEDKLAVVIGLVPELSADKMAFRYAVKDTCIYQYSIAKTIRSYDYIDLSLAITFKSISASEGQYDIDILRTTTLTIPMIHVGATEKLTEKVYSGWIPLPPRSTIGTAVNDKSREDKTVVKSNGSSSDTTKQQTTVTKYDIEGYERLADNTGLYEIAIVATETNPYKIRAEHKQTVIEQSAGPGADLIDAIIETLAND